MSSSSTGTAYFPLSSSSDYDSTFSLICLKYGVPCVLFFIFNLLSFHAFDYRLWKLRIWLHRSTQRLHLRHLFAFAALHDSAKLKTDNEEAELEKLRSQENASRQEKTQAATATRTDQLAAPVELSQLQASQDKKKAAAAAAKAKPLTEAQKLKLKEDKDMAWAQYHVKLRAKKRQIEAEQSKDRVDNAEQRLFIGPWLAAGSFFSFLVPLSLMVVWAALLIYKSYKLEGIALLCMFISLSSVYYGFQLWRTSGWHMNRVIGFLFSLAFIAYFLMAFLLGFLSHSVTFFGRSIHFLCMNYLCIVELICQSEANFSLNAIPFLSLSKDKLSPAEEKRKLMEKRKKERKQLNLLSLGILSDWSDEEEEDQSALLSKDKIAMFENSSQQRTAPKSDEYSDQPTVALLDIQHANVDFKEAVEIQLEDYKLVERIKQKKRMFTFYGLGIAILLAYSLSILKTDEGNNWLGFIVSIVVISLDIMLYAYTACNRMTSDETKLLVLAGSRVALISFGYNSWFLGVCLVYFAAGIYLVYSSIDMRFPYDYLLSDLKKKGAGNKNKELMLLNQFVKTIEPPESLNGDSQLIHSRFIDTIKNSHLKIPEFLLIMLTVLFFMCMALSYTTSLDPVTIDRADRPFQLHYIGLGVFALVILFLSSFLTLRSFQYFDWRLCKRTVYPFIVTEILFAGTAYCVFDQTSSVILITLLVAFPLLVISIVGTYTQCVKNDWRILVDPELRNPPNANFLFALIKCGLAHGDYLMFAGFIGTNLLILAIGLVISLLVTPTYIGWSISLVLIILIASIAPMFKYFQTLAVDGIDQLSIVVFLGVHSALFGLLHGELNLSLPNQYIFWVIFAAYPVGLLLIAGLYDLKENQWDFNAFNIFAFVITVSTVIGMGIASFFFLESTTVGIVILVALAIILTICAIAIKWVLGNFTLPRWLRNILIGIEVFIFAGGVAAGFALPTGYGFWAFSACWWLLILQVLLMGFGRRRRVEAGNNIFRYSEYLFPVYYFDKRTDDVAQENMHAGLYLLAFGLFYLWCVAAMCTDRISAGLGASALNTVFLYTFVRNRMLSSVKQFQPIIPYVDEKIIAQVKKQALDTQLDGSSVEITPDLRNAIKLGLNPHHYYLNRLEQLQTEMGLNHWCFCRRLNVNYLDMDSLFSELEHCHKLARGISKVQFRIEAHFFFLLLTVARTQIAQEQALFKQFCQWIKEKTGETLNPYISNEEIYSTSRPWSEDRILQFMEFKAEFLSSRAQQSQQNADNREIEKAAQNRRQEIIETQVDLSQHQPDKVDQLFMEIVEKYKKTGKKWEDPDFPAKPQSIYIGGQRDTTRPSAVHAATIHEEWKRPEEIVQALREGGDASAPKDGERPVICESGFSMADVVQGNIGSCYLLSAVGVMALREVGQAEGGLLTKVFPTIEHQIDCGAYIVRFYRQGQEVKVLVDDRFPVQPNGQIAFSHCQHPCELWVALIEKAYAKLFTCYEAIEAGFINQALVDLTNGAGEEVRLKDQAGNLVVNAETLWVQLKDAFDAGYLLGAGSNAGTNDQFVNGLVLGHAYGVANMYSDAENKLIQLQNPWGHGEWTGDWCDSSDKWTRYYKSKLNWAEKDDGRFWMSFADFLLHYENVYVCRMMPMRQSLRSEWRGKTAAGPRTPADNPHFTVRVNKPMKVWIELEQDPNRGENKKLAYIQFYVVSNGGTRLQKITREIVLGWANKGKLVNTRQVSAEVYLDQPNKDYTIVCACNEAKVETGFTLSVFSTEPVTFQPFKDNQPTEEETKEKSKKK